MRHLWLAATLAAAIGLAGGQAQAEALAPGTAPAETGAADPAVLPQLARAQADFERGEFVQVIQALTPAVEEGVYDGLSAEMKYAVLGLYARSLFSLAIWDEAHEALVSLTDDNSHATVDDWAYRFVAAQKLGDVADAERVFQHLLPSTPAADAPGA